MLLTTFGGGGGEGVIDTPQEDVIDNDRGNVIHALDVPEVGCLM